MRLTTQSSAALGEHLISAAMYQMDRQRCRVPLLGEACRWTVRLLCVACALPPLVTEKADGQGGLAAAHSLLVTTFLLRMEVEPCLLRDSVEEVGVAFRYCQAVVDPRV